MNRRTGPVLEPGRNCWRIERADRLALIVDAADYFRTVKAAMLNAEHSIMLIGWDFDTRIAFEPEGSTLEGPNRLGAFLSWLPKRRPGLRVYVLKWDLGMLQALGRGMTPFFIANWLTGKRVSLRLDGAHPVGAAHHQKIVVIDDAVAFCGGIDMTVDRWDTRQHRPADARRKQPSGKDHGPWHDATTAVDGDVARALGELARERWRRATGDRLDPAPAGAGAWPDGLAPTLEHVDVAIARTHPALEDRAEVREIEALYLDAIARAERTIYIESQYLASRRIAEALARRLGEPDGPEIVLVLPRTTEGWLEHKAMDGARKKLFGMLWRADRRNRFGVYYPVAEDATPIYVHAKIMAIDDTLLRVGSSNLNNRSLGFDTECDLAIEAVGDANPARIRAAIAAIRSDLLCEHLDVAPEAFATALGAAGGSVLKTIESLRGAGRALMPFDPAEVESDDSALAENELLDPESARPRMKDRLMRTLSSVAGSLRRAK